MRYYDIYGEICSWPRVAIIGLMAILACIALVGEVSGRRVANERASRTLKTAPVVREYQDQGDKASMVNKSDDATTSDAARPAGEPLAGCFLPEYGHVYAIV